MPVLFTDYIFTLVCCTWSFLIEFYLLLLVVETHFITAKLSWKDAVPLSTPLIYFVQDFSIICMYTHLCIVYLQVYKQNFFIITYYEKSHSFKS